MYLSKQEILDYGQEGKEGRQAGAGIPTCISKPNERAPSTGTCILIWRMIRIPMIPPS